MCKYIIVSEVQVNISHALIRASLDNTKYHIDKNYKGEQKGIFYLASGRKARINEWQLHGGKFKINRK